MRVAHVRAADLVANVWHLLMPFMRMSARYLPPRLVMEAISPPCGAIITAMHNLAPVQQIVWGPVSVATGAGLFGINLVSNLYHYEANYSLFWSILVSLCTIY